MGMLIIDKITNIRTLFFIILTLSPLYNYYGFLPRPLLNSSLHEDWLSLLKLGVHNVEQSKYHQPLVLIYFYSSSPHIQLSILLQGAGNHHQLCNNCSHEWKMLTFHTSVMVSEAINKNCRASEQCHAWYFWNILIYRRYLAMAQY